MPKPKRFFDVVVIGGGPVGLSTAHLLGRAGVSTLLVERHASTSRHPRASGIHGRTMDLFRQWGIADDVRRLGLPVERAQGFIWLTRLKGIELGRLMFSDGTDGPHDDPGPEAPCFCPQPAYERLLLATASAHPSVSVEFLREVDALSQDRDEVTLDVRQLDRGMSESIHARYVVAADGAASPARHQLGIPETGTERFGHSVNVHFRADLGGYVEDKPFMLFWIVNGETQGTLASASRDHTRWTYNFDGQHDVDYPDAALVDQIRKAIGAADLEVELLEVLRWDYEQAVSDRWRAGRILLAGDAAHRFPPHGAFGMNSGVQDTDNLTWKLIQVLQGSAGAALLDTYQAERKPVAEQNSRLALANTRALADTGWHNERRDEFATIELDEGRELRRRIGLAVSKQRAHLHAEGHQYGTIYVSGAVIPDGTLPIQSTVSDYHETGSPGARAPHLWLRTQTGRRLSTIDLWDGGFVLLSGGDAVEWEAAAISLSERHRIQLTSRRIGTGSDLVAEGRSWEGKYGVSSGGAVLVRPDGHVAARFRQRPGNAERTLEDSILRILHPDRELDEARSDATPLHEDGTARCTKAQ